MKPPSLFHAVVVAGAALSGCYEHHRIERPVDAGRDTFVARFDATIRDTAPDVAADAARDCDACPLCSSDEWCIENCDFACIL